MFDRWYNEIKLYAILQLKNYDHISNQDRHNLEKNK